jgi:hypothetical protein
MFPCIRAARVEAERDTLKQSIDRFHHVMHKAGLHPGRTDDDLLEILERNFAERDALKDELRSEQAIVTRIWEQLGNPSYASLKGRSIYDLIDALKAYAERWQYARDQVFCHWSTYKDNTLCASVATLQVPFPNVFGKIGDPPPEFDIDAAIDAAIDVAQREG